MELRARIWHQFDLFTGRKPKSNNGYILTVNLMKEKKYIQRNKKSNENVKELINK